MNNSQFYSDEGVLLFVLLGVLALAIGHEPVMIAFFIIAFVLAMMNYS